MLRKVLMMSFAFLLVGGVVGFTVGAKEQGPVKVEVVEWKALMEKGYSKEDIFKAKGIAKLAKKDIGEVLKQYKASGSWEQTAKHYNLDWEKLKAKHDEMKAKHEERKKFYKENEAAILEYLAEFTNTPVEEVQKLKAGEKFCPFKLTKAAVISKLSERPLLDVWNEYVEGTSLKEIAKNSNIDKKTIWTEMKTLQESMKDEIGS